jgi:acetolactate synthase-1/3 small subunit
VASNEQTVTALVENKAGVLARVVGLFARRGFNISSLAVAPTDDERFSRITFVYDIGSAPVEQVVNQVNKLVNVIHIEAIDAANAVERELLLATIAAGPEDRGHLIELVGLFEGKVVDVGHDSLTVMLAGRPDKLDDFEALARPYGIRALQRTGRIALPLVEREMRPSLRVVGSETGN